MNLIDSYGKRGIRLNLSRQKIDITDNEYLSKYFVLSEFNPKFTAGKNSISINGSSYLKNNTEIYVECLDSAGNNLYVEMAKTDGLVAYKESNSYIISIHVYNDTANGIGKLLLYGQTIDNLYVLWSGNISIDKTLRNISTTRFYQRPSLTVSPILTPVLGADISSTIKQTIEFTGKALGLAVDPPVSTTINSVNRVNVDLDYEIIVVDPPILQNTIDINSLNSQMDNATLVLKLNKIQKPSSNQTITPIPSTQSFAIKKIINNKTFQLIDPFIYADNNKNYLISNIIDTDFSVVYPYIGYNNSSASYLISNVGGTNYIIKQSYADITYENIRTFSGYVARHKVYRKSLLSNADFTIISDEPLTINELLRDNITQNKFYERLGVFYNDQHIDRYWFTSSSDINLIHTPDVYINSVKIESSDYNLMDGTKYIIVKNDSINSQRDATYIPYNSSEFTSTSGSSYDSNFINVKRNTNYILSLNAIIYKDPNESDSYLRIFFTSSLANSTQEKNYSTKYGIQLGEFKVPKSVSSKRFESQLFFFSPNNDLYGTLVIVPYKCKATLYDISFRVYGDDGFSPDIFTTRIPWTITTPNESFQIKAELFDINSNLIYSNLNALQNFDPSGSSLVPYIPVGGSGSLTISGSLLIQNGDIIIQDGVIYAPELLYRNVITQSRFMVWNGHTGPIGQINKTTVVDISHDDQYISLSTGSTIDESNTGPISIKKSIASEYGGSFGRKYYWDNSGEHIEIN